MKRGKQFKFTLSPGEHKALVAHAENAGMTPTDILRQFIRGLDEFQPPTPKKKKP